ncbi:hypothetical protein EFE23_04270 [Micromonospora solifontis]|uniref:Uncharacterized protein n=2 Tax=Micromonosporaceae TaxID=28056 RepID=A0ABX9WKH2_9ACTN|nr:hypothetical protein EFE23_04270 [Micromonospora solifontis]
MWGATLRSLRRLTRMAATALVLVVGLNGLTAPVPADPFRPVSTVRPLADLRVAPGPADAPAGPLLPGSSAATGWTTTITPADGAGTADSRTRHPRVGSTAPAAGVPARHIDSGGAAARTTAAVAAPADPGPGSVTRRGPPRA